MSDTDNMIEPLLNVDEVAELLRISPAGVRRHVAAGELRAIRIGKHLRFRPADIRDSLDEMST